MPSELLITPRTQLKRIKERASYDQSAIYAVIDAALMGTIAFCEGGHVHAIPTAIWRENDFLYIHGSNGSRMLKTLQTGAQACVSITQLDGLVLARSAFHHSMNYSSVCIYGVFEVVAETEKEKHLRYFLEHWVPGRWEYLRTPDKTELAATTIMRIPIVEAVLKSRSGPPKDDATDMEQNVWAGVVPLKLRWGEPEQVAQQAEVNLPGQFVTPVKK